MPRLRAWLSPCSDCFAKTALADLAIENFLEMRDKNGVVRISREEKARSPARGRTARHLSPSLHDGDFYKDSLRSSSPARPCPGPHRLREFSVRRPDRGVANRPTHTSLSG